MSVLRRDPRLLLLAVLASVTSSALSLTGEVPPVGLVVPACAVLAVLRPRTTPRSRAFEWTFQLVALGFLAWFVVSLSRMQLLAGAAALTFPVLVHSFLRPPTLDALRRIQTISFFQLVALAASTTAIFFGPLLLVHLALAPAVFTLGALEAARGEPRHPAELPRGLRRASWLASGACLLGGVAGFLVLPRYEAGLLSELRARGRKISGFSESVSLGDITSIQSSDAVVMRVRLRGEVPKDLRWRGIALDQFTGRMWAVTAPPMKATPRGGAHQVGEPIPGRPRCVQEITVEPGPIRALFHLPRAVTVLPQTFRGVRADAWGNIQRTGEPTRRGRYEVVSELGPSAEELPDEQRAAFLQLPRLDPRIPELAREAAGEGTDAEKAARLRAFLPSRCEYGLDVNDLGVEDPLAWFLFEKRRGHCEYFATSLAVMLRSVGIPARVVNGFREGEYSRLFDAWIVRQRDAHSWVEAWIPGRGWTTYDATPAAGLGRAPLGDALEAWRQVLVFWDDNVIGFNYTFQLGFLTRAGEAAAAVRGWAGRNAGVLALGAAAAAGLVAVLVASRVSRHLRSRRRRPRVEFYERAAKLLARRGHRRAPSQTPWELARAVASRDPALGEAALEITRLYYDARFGGMTPDPARVAELLRRLAA